MKVEILRNPGLDLPHELTAKGFTEPLEIPDDLAEGQTRDVPDKVAEALIACGVARIPPGKEKAAAAHPPPPAGHKDKDKPPAK